MPKTTKQQFNVRLTKTGRELLQQLAHKLGISQAAVVELMIRQQAWVIEQDRDNVALSSLDEHELKD